MAVALGLDALWSLNVLLLLIAWFVYAGARGEERAVVADNPSRW